MNVVTRTVAAVAVCTVLVPVAAAQGLDWWRASETRNAPSSYALSTSADGRWRTPGCGRARAAPCTLQR